jgi:hypothetical protein
VTHGDREDTPYGERITRSVDGHEVGLLDQQRASRAERGRHAPEGSALVGQPLDQVSRVDEVEPGRQGLGRDVVAKHFQRGVIVRPGLEEVRLQIGGHDHAGRRDALGEPESHRSAAGPDLEAARSRAGAEADQVVAGPGVQRRLQPGEPHTLHLPGVVVLVTLGHGPRVRSAGAWEKRPREGRAARRHDAEARARIGFRH